MGCGRLSRSALISSLDSVSGSPGTVADVAVVVVVLVQILPDDALAGPLCVDVLWGCIPSPIKSGSSVGIKLVVVRFRVCLV